MIRQVIGRMHAPTAGRKHMALMVDATKYRKQSFWETLFIVLAVSSACALAAWIILVGS